MRRWRESLAVYRDRRMLVILALGFSSGLPLLLLFSTLSLWLKDAGLSVQAIGLFAAARIPYSFKFLWAPLMDRLPIPGLSSVLGRRRSWLLVTQLGLAVAIVQLALSDPASTPEITRWLAIAVGVLSASQDIVVDAYRIDRLPAEDQGAGAAAAITGYRLGMLASGAGALSLAGLGVTWETTYQIMAGFMAVGVITTLLCREPDAAVPAAELPEASKANPPEARAVQPVGRRVAMHLYHAVIAPFIDLLRRHGLATVLLLVPFAILFKLGDALAATMSNVFLADVGFTKTQIGGIAQGYGLGATILGVFVGGWVVRGVGMMRALWLGGLVQMASNLMYMLQAHVGANSWVLTATIGIEHLSGGVGDIVFVAYLSSLCNRSYSATQYALLSALASLVRNVATMFTGYWAADMGWPGFFLFTAVAAVPGLVALYALGRWGSASSPARA